MNSAHIRYTWLFKHTYRIPIRYLFGYLVLHEMRTDSRNHIQKYTRPFTPGERARFLCVQICNEKK